MINLDKVQVGDPIWMYRPKIGHYYKAKVIELIKSNSFMSSNQPFAIVVEYKTNPNKTVQKRINRFNSSDRLIEDLIEGGSTNERLRNFKFGIQSYSFSSCEDMLIFVDSYVKKTFINKNLQERIQSSKIRESSLWI